uniref:KN motif and ankyrin repeat domains 2 n=1 Tax=Naja naja TaxID=35670 RepID=A0A8C6Y9D6_NAJNA
MSLVFHFFSITRLGLSKELLSACAVLQKYLETYTSMLHYWLKLSCHKEADPDLISLHLTDFRAVSPQLLEFIINMADANGNTALHYTVSHSNFPLVAKLIETGLCHVDQQNKAGYTAIMLTALAASQTESDMDTIKQLLKKGNVNAKANQAGQTALMLAVSHGRLEMVRALLASAADVNLQDDDGSTALMCACEHGHAEIVRLLLANPECDVAQSDNVSPPSTVIYHSFPII